MLHRSWLCRTWLVSRQAVVVQRSTVRLQSTAAAPAANNPVSHLLLSRARATAKEHAKLSDKVAANFDTASAKRLGELSPVANAVKEWEEASDNIEELNALLRDPTTDSELRDLASDDVVNANERLARASQSLTAALVPKHPFASLPCLIEIRPGVGGEEAALFAGDLLRMYKAYCARQGLRVSLLKYEDSDGTSDPSGSDSPLQEAILEVTSPGAYDMLRTEAGVHRVQRVPATESKGRVHTSAVSVLVLPNLGEQGGDAGADNFEDPSSDYYVSPADVRTDVMRARGAGGQHVNTTDSAVRLTHLPTNTVVAVQAERSQLKNRAKAWQILRARLAQQKREAREEEMLKFRRSTAGHGKSGRSDKIRTYNWSQQRVTDHRSGITINQLDSVIEGGVGLDTVVESVKAWMQEEEIYALTAEAESLSKDDKPATGPAKR